MGLVGGRRSAPSLPSALVGTLPCDVLDRFVRVSGGFNQARDSCPKKREEKGRSLPWLALKPDPASVTLDDALYVGQSDAGPLIFLVIVEPVKWREQELGLVHIKSTTIIAHKKDRILFSREFGDQIDLDF